MKVAVEGCCHGELDKIYETLQFIEQKDKIKVDLLLICGDFQAVRNHSDLQAMAVPPKFQKLNTFYKYYNGEKKAPVLTVIIGGNHEASNYLQELPYGGWLAPNIYYLGYAGVVKFGGLRIAGMSGIYKARDYNKGHYEHPPYNEDTKRTVYHVRNVDVFRLKQIKQDVDIFLSHDWPRGIYNYGNVSALLRRKKYFKEEVDQGTLGNPAAEDLLFTLKPAHWFSAHLHCKFAAIVQHKATEGCKSKTTKFLALDKCLPKRSFLQVLDIEHPAGAAMQLELDPEWLCILKSTNHLLNLTKSQTYMPGLGSSERYDFTPTEEEIMELKSDFDGLFKIPENFTKTTEPYRSQDGAPQKKHRSDPPQIHINAQTTLLCEMLGLIDPFAVFSGKQSHAPLDNQVLAAPKMLNDDSDVGLEDEEEDEGVRSDEDSVPSFIDSTMDTTFETSQEGAAFNVTSNPDEISLEDIEDLDEDKSQSDSNMDTSAISGEGAASGGGGSGTDTEMNISVTGGIINVLSSSDASLNVSALISSANVASPISRHEPQGSSTPQPVRTKLVLAKPTGTSPPKKDSSLEGANLLGKRLSDEQRDSSQDSGSEKAARPGPSQAKKFKRRNQSIYQESTDENE